MGHNTLSFARCSEADVAFDLNNSDEKTEVLIGLFLWLYSQVLAMRPGGESGTLSLPEVCVPGRSLVARKKRRADVEKPTQARNQKASGKSFQEVVYGLILTPFRQVLESHRKNSEGE